MQIEVAKAKTNQLGGRAQVDRGPAADVNVDNQSSPAFSFHPRGAQAVMCDGSVHFLHEAIDWKALTALLTANAGDVLLDKDWRK